MRQSWASVVVLLSGLAVGTAGCAHRHGVASRDADDARSELQDPTDLLIARADSHLAAGTASIRSGHVQKARQEFDRALDVYLTVAGGAFSSPRLAEAYRRTLEAIQLQERAAHAAGDGFAETAPEPAAIDAVAELTVADAAPASEDVRRTSEEVVAAEPNDLPIELNPAVLACIELYQGRLRDWFAEALARSGRYLPGIREAFAAEGIPQDLAYVALVESAFKPHALSRAKAKGVWQFISATGRRFGLRQDWWVDERSDPEKATLAAARYLKSLHEMFGDWNLALAAYNSGEGRVRRAVARYNSSDFWELSRTRGLPRETKNYVPLIHAAIVVAKAPERYGFHVTLESPVPTDEVPVDGAFDLRVVAECAGLEVDEVRSLNPELRRLATPANRTYALRVPAGTGDGLKSCLGAVPPDSRVRFRTHVVARGQTVSSIARRYGTTTRDVMDANGLRSPRRLRIGTELIIPVRPGGAQVRTASLRTDPDGDRILIRYRVRRGDTLSAIASRHGATVREVQSWNNLTGTHIVAGDTLKLYAR